MQIRDLVEVIVRSLVDSPGEVEVQEIEGTTLKILEIKVSKSEIGYLLGKRGKNIDALRTIVSAAAKGQRYMVEVLDQRSIKGSQVRRNNNGEENHKTASV
jgi:hypothetical protein